MTSAITTIGLDLAKTVFQVHCVESDGSIAIDGDQRLRLVT